jgi:amino acid adenylation domain-containing protein
VFEGQKLTYQALNTSANQLAHYLIEQRVSAETLVGICVERSLEMVIGLLGILKAGGAYVPLDPDYPVPRLQFLLEDSQVPVLLTQSHLIARLPAPNALVVGLDSEWNRIAAYSGSNPERQSGPDNLAYVIYTSGSTGNPKGVMVEQAALSNFIRSAIDSYSITSHDKILQFASSSFDAAAEEIYPTLSQGATLVLRTTEVLNSMETFLAFCANQQLTVLYLPTAYWHSLLADIQTTRKHWPDCIRMILIGGEAASGETVKQWMQHFADYPALLNEYGPTETTIVTTYCHLGRGNLTTVPIGQPIANTQIYILDALNNPTPIGIPGELGIAGRGLARGYLNRPELTLSKFIEVELFGEPKRLYKTGDLARWREDGNLEYLGRLDHQVKLRGFRIELGEIEATLTQHDAVREAVVVLIKEESNPRLAAYVTLATPIDDCATVLRTWLKARLPEYMIPAHIMSLEQLPLTPNGKIDRNALPAPDLAQPFDLVEPQTDVERLLSQIWSEVLGYDITNTQTDFFEAGGHSLLVTQLVSRIRERFAVEMPLKKVFEHARLFEQADWLAHQQRGTSLPPLTPLGEGEPLVLSFAQQRLWFLAQLEGPSATYNMPAALRLQGELSQSALQQTFQNLIEHHLNLRLCFPEVDGQATVQVLAVYNPYGLIDLSALPFEQQQRVANPLIEAFAIAPFDLTTGPLMRALLLKLKAHEHLLLFNMHHIISDGWSISVLVRQWSELYEAHLKNRAPELPARSIQYPDYAAWQRNWLACELLERQLSYWKEQLAGAPALLELPTDYPRPAVMTYQGAHLQTRLAAELTRRLKSFSQLNGVTLYMTLLAAFQILLSRYSGQTDILVGSPIANRTHRQTEDLIGFFVNTLVLRTQVDSKVSGTGLLKQVRQTALQAYAHQDIPFEYLVEQLNPARSLSHSPLFQVMLVLQNVPQEQLVIKGLKVSVEDTDSTIAKFDLTLSVAEHEQKLVCDWEYRTDLFRPATVKRMTEHFEVLLEGLINQPTQTVGQLPLLTSAEQQQLIVWNQTQTDYPFEKTIVDLFQEQVEKNPSNLAVVFEGQKLTYQALNSKANQLAHYLIEKGVSAETLVGICVTRSLEMVIGLLGILKAGGAYVPLDPDYPAPRLQFLLEDSQVPVLLTQSHLIEQLPASIAKLVDLDREWATIAAYSDDNPVRLRCPENLAYVIYTSGSTGKPKGTLLTHEGLSNYLFWAVNEYHLTRGIGAPVQSSLAFDATITSLYLPLLSGTRVVLLPDKLESLAETLCRTNHPFSLIKITPAHLEALNQQLDQSEYAQSTEALIIGGEALTTAPIQPWLTLAPKTRLINEYGPTEAVVGCCIYDAQGHELSANVPIGRPIANTQIYILDAHHNPTPIGIPGELCIAGRGLARGYLNRPELTLSKFIEVDIFGEPKRLYKTGDLARWREDGNLEYLGRRDHQIKLRGFRIELGEIEATLTQHEAVHEAVVVLIKDEGNSRLAAYVTLATPIDDYAPVLRTWLKARLPEYMMPAHVMSLEQLPLTPNGKIDRNALPAPDAQVNKHYQAPRDTVELQLAQIWENVLEVRPIGIFENFFELGGHSLLAVKLMSFIFGAFDKHLPIATLFQGATIAELAQLIRHHEAPTTWPTLIPIQLRGSRLPLFCLPGIGSNVFSFHALVAHLDKDQPSYGLQPPGLDGKTVPIESIEALAALHLKELSKVQPQGPYFLAGHSFGGQVAFELARQLERQGETVALLAILDTSAPTSQREDDDTALMNETDWLWTIVEILEELSETKLGLSKEMFQSQATLAQSYELVMQSLKQHGIFFAPTAESEQLKAMVDTYKANHHAHTHYQPQGPLKAPIVLFRAEEQPEDTPSVLCDDLEWSQYTEGQVIVIKVPGTHLTMLNEPHVKTLAAQLHTQLLLSKTATNNRL